jgi:hypothetical protein
MVSIMLHVTLSAPHGETWVLGYEFIVSLGVLRHRMTREAIFILHRAKWSAVAPTTISLDRFVRV